MPEPSTWAMILIGLLIRASAILKPMSATYVRR
ncbi:MAG: PEP-CTERM sorting domain-containing protein [Verrucomicrobia bacterium]|nr:PEP-CTERM sorting domain-containing protein [Verrucomicrobiota bacterium]